MRSLRKSRVLEPLFNAAIAGDLSEFPQLARIRGRTEAEKLFMEKFRNLKEKAAAPAKAGFVNNLIHIYRNYWIQALLAPESAIRHEKLLFELAASLLQAHGATVRTTDKGRIEAKITDHLSTLGLRSLLGVVKPLRELQIWSDEKVRKYDIKIPRRQVVVDVTFISGFRCRGWLSFITQNIYSVGGWATKKSLICNASAYRLDSEAFRIGYLAHEAQHFADYRRFPRLAPHDLEYRAKLTELALADRTRKATLQKFSRLGRPDRNSPHSLANYFVIADLAKALGTVGDPTGWSDRPTALLNQAARNLLSHHDDLLRSQGARSTQGTIWRRKLL